MHYPLEEALTPALADFYRTLFCSYQAADRQPDRLALYTQAPCPSPPGGGPSLSPKSIENTRCQRRQRKFLQGAEADLHCDTMVQFCGATPPPPRGGRPLHDRPSPPPWVWPDIGRGDYKGGGRYHISSQSALNRGKEEARQANTHTPPEYPTRTPHPNTPPEHPTPTPHPNTPPEHPTCDLIFCLQRVCLLHHDCFVCLSSLFLTSSGVHARACWHPGE